MCVCVCVCACVCGCHHILPLILAENLAHREDVRQKLNDSNEWREYAKIVGESITEPVGRSVGQ